MSVHQDVDPPETADCRPDEALGDGLPAHIARHGKRRGADPCEGTRGAREAPLVLAVEHAPGPSRAKATAVASPMPAEEPVTITTRSVNRPFTAGTHRAGEDPHGDAAATTGFRRTPMRSISTSARSPGRSQKAPGSGRPPERQPRRASR